MIRLNPISLFCFFAIAVVGSSKADQFVLFDVTFEMTKAEADEKKSHYFVTKEMLNKATPKDWTAPGDYRNGTIHLRLEVLEKPAGDVPTTWSVCYLPNKGQKNGYGCTNTQLYTEEGVYEKEVDMTKFWNHDSIIWTEGIRQMSLVMKGNGGGKDHAHLREDTEHFFPTKVRFTLVQVSKGAKYDPALMPE
ncbi:hypothetical protein N9B73_02035 [Verrucomicrobiales bacterium]|nr:hypothetical protein [Verrucomicrobiales bacterium]